LILYGKNVENVDFSETVNLNFNLFKAAGGNARIKLPSTDADDFGPARNEGNYILGVDFSKTRGNLRIYED